MDNIQVLQYKAAKIILDKPLHSSSSKAQLAALNWITLDKRRFYHRCLYAYKCVNGYIYHSKELLKQGETYNYNLRNEDNLRLPRVVRNWGKFRMGYHAAKDRNSLTADIRNSPNIYTFKRNFFRFLLEQFYYIVYIYCYIYL